MTMSCDDAGISGAQRLEIFTGASKRRDWPPKVKVSIVAESYSGQESISAVARRHAMCPSQLFHGARAAQADAGSRTGIARHPGGPAAVRPRSSGAVSAKRRWSGRQASTMSAAIIARGCGAGDRWSGHEDRARCRQGVDSRGNPSSQGDAMIGPGVGARVMVTTRPVDFRKGSDSLAALVGAEYGGDPFSGVIYVFRAKRSDRIKLIWWDGTGWLVSDGQEAGARRLSLARHPGRRDAHYRSPTRRIAGGFGLAPRAWWSPYHGTADHRLTRL